MTFVVNHTSELDPAQLRLIWELIELTDGARLRAEGAALHHCAAIYAYRCWRGASQIWSLRRCRDMQARSVVTVEVDPARRAIVQARGHFNRPASGQAWRVIQTWAEREHLRLAIPRTH